MINSKLNGFNGLSPYNINLIIEHTNLDRSKLNNELNKMLIRENRINLYKDCLKFINTRVNLDLECFPDDVWSH